MLFRFFENIFYQYIVWTRSQNTLRVVTQVSKKKWKGRKYFLKKLATRNVCAKIAHILFKLNTSAQQHKKTRTNEKRDVATPAASGQKDKRGRECLPAVPSRTRTLVHFDALVLRQTFFHESFEFQRQKLYLYTSQWPWKCSHLPGQLWIELQLTALHSELQPNLRQT